MIERRVIRIKEMAARMGCTPRYIAILIDSGKLRGFRLPGSRHRRAYEDEFEAFLKRHRVTQ